MGTGIEWTRASRRDGGLRACGRAAGALALALACGACAGWPPGPPAELPIHATHVAGEPLRAGAAAVDVTPEAEVWLAGFLPHRKSEGVHDPLFARALVLEAGPLRLALVAVDVIGLQREDLLAWHPRLREAGFDPRHVVIHATHNHSGPDTLGLWGVPPFVSGQDERYMERLATAVVAALEQASASLRPAELAAGAKRIDPAGIMRNLRRPGLVDRELVVVHVRERGQEGRGGASIATLVELGCHPEVLGPDNRLVTADFPGWTVAELEAELGGVGLFVSGALGGLVTPDVEEGFPEGPGGSFEEAERVGRRVARLAVERVRAFSRYEAEPRIALRHAPFLVRNENPRYRLARWTGILDRTMYRGGYLLSEANVWAIGRLRVATIPGEITPDLGLRIKRAVGGEPTLLVGLANDELGYLLPAADFDLPIYDYERTVSPGPGVGDRVYRLLEDLGLLLDRSGVEPRASAGR